MSGGRLAAIVLIAQATVAVAEARGGEWETCRWDPLTVWGEHPAPRSDYQMAADLMSGRLFIFGGRTEQGLENDLWLFDAATGKFVKIEPAAGSPRPTPRAGGMMVWAGPRRELLLFGGEGGGIVRGGAWTFDFPTRWWHRLEPPPGRSPAPDVTGAIAYDPESDRVVFGGGVAKRQGTSGGSDESWVLDLGRRTWQRLDTAPRIRRGALMAMDPAGARAVLIGEGSFPDGHRRAEAWQFDFHECEWSHLSSDTRLGVFEHGLGAVFTAPDELLLVLCRHYRERDAEILVMRLDLSSGAWSVVETQGSFERGGRPTARSSAGAGVIGVARARPGDSEIAGLLLFGGLPESEGGHGIRPLEDIWLLRSR